MTSSSVRYRYPIYNKRSAFEDADGDEDIGEDSPSKRFVSGLGLRQLSPKNKKPYGLSPRYDLTITPYDLKVMEKLYRSGRRKRTPDLNDLKQGYKIYEAGRKRGLPVFEDDGERRKKSGDFTNDVWDMAHMADVGKRFPVTSYYDLLDMAKLAKAGSVRARTATVSGSWRRWRRRERSGAASATMTCCRWPESPTQGACRLAPHHPVRLGPSGRPGRR